MRQDRSYGLHFRCFDPAVTVQEDLFHIGKSRLTSDVQFGDNPKADAHTEQTVGNSTPLGLGLWIGRLLLELDFDALHVRRAHDQYVWRIYSMAVSDEVFDLQRLFQEPKITSIEFAVAEVIVLEGGMGEHRVFSDNAVQPLSTSPTSTFTVALIVGVWRLSNKMGRFDPSMHHRIEVAGPRTWGGEPSALARSRLRTQRLRGRPSSDCRSEQ